MYLLFHIFTALTAGCILAVLLKNRMAVFWCALGGLIPDFMDKVFGHFTFYEIIGTEYRMYFHSLFFALICLIIGIILLVRNRNRIALFCVSIGIIIHFIGDEVWLNVKTFFWPFLGNIISPDKLQIMVESGKLMTLIISVLAALLFIVIYAVHSQRMKPVHTFIYWISFTLTMILIQVTAMLIFNAETRGGQQSNWNYFFDVLGQETSMFSEWVFGIASLILLILVFLSWFNRDIHNSEIAAVVGFDCIVCGIILLVYRLLGVMIDAHYSFTNVIWASSAMIICGCIIMLLSKKVFGNLNPPETDVKE